MTRGQFWRQRETEVPDCKVEAYLWGNDTTPLARAMLMLLLPFTLINVAYWARPPYASGLGYWLADRAVGVICRLLGLTLTVTLVLAATGASVDLFAWQCLGTVTCTTSWPQPFDLLGEVPLAAGQRLAIGAVVPLLLVIGLWYHSYVTWRRHERRAAIPIPGGDRLRSARFWRGREWVDRLRSSHVLVGLTAVNAVVLAPTLRADLTHHDPMLAVGYALLVILAAALVAAVVGAVAPLTSESEPVKRDPVPASPDSPPGRAKVAYAWAVNRTEDLVDALRARVRSAASPVTSAIRRAAWAMLGVTVATLLYAALPRAVPMVPSGPLPGYATAVVVTSVLQVVLVVSLGVAVVPLCRSGRRLGQRMALSGFVAPIIAATACMLAVAEAAGTLYFTALSIGQLRPSGSGRAWEPAPPYPYEWAGVIFAVVLGCAAVAGAVLLVSWRRLVRQGARLTDERDAALREEDPDAAVLIDHGHARGRVLDAMPGLCLIIFVPAAALSLLGVVFSVAGQGPSVLLPSTALANLGTWSIGLLSIVVVYLVARTGAMTPVRRTISTVWALATFWPRAAHPFAAPAHGPRAVADLVSRVSRLSEQGSAVLIAGHSHGSLLATITASYLPPHVAARAGLLTSACTGPRLIEPFFGAFFNQTLCHDVADALDGPGGPRWRNLYRLTDPLGGPVFIRVPGRASGPGLDGPVDRLVPDPPSIDLRLGVDPTPRGHDHYLRDPVFREEHARLVRRLAVPPAAGTVSPRRPAAQPEPQR